MNPRELQNGYNEQGRMSLDVSEAERYSSNMKSQGHYQLLSINILYANYVPQYQYQNVHVLPFRLIVTNVYTDRM